MQHGDEHQLKKALVHGAIGAIHGAICNTAKNTNRKVPWCMALLVLYCYGAMVHGAIGAIHGAICNIDKLIGKVPFCNAIQSNAMSKVYMPSNAM